MEAEDSKSQIEVWEWKEKVSQEWNSLPEGERMNYFIKKNASLIAKLGLKKAALKAALK